MSKVLHCWEDRHSFYLAQHPGALFVPDDIVNGTCMLLDGHDGPHEFTNDSDITVTFK